MIETQAPNAQPASTPRQFVTVSSICPATRATWDGKTILTFDIDWACDEVIEETIDLVEQAKTPATWFITHDSPVLGRLRANPVFELGIHPNFLFLLDGDGRNGRNAEEVLDRLLTIVPEAKSVRCHSLVQSGRLLQLFAKKGLTHDCNAFIPARSAIELKPWVAWFDIIQVPYGWEDDFTAATNAWDDGTPPADSGLEGFDFHPIHVFLNTESLDRYEATRDLHREPALLLDKRHRGYGTRTALLEVLSSTEIGIGAGDD
jgi:hypothetical protein